VIDPVDGRMRIGEEDFNLKTLGKWHRRQWDHAFAPLISTTRDSRRFVSPLDALSHALSLLEADAWASPEDLEAVLKIFCNKDPKRPGADEICQKGFEKGILARRIEDNKTWYRPARSFTEMADGYDPGADLMIDPHGNLRIKLETVPVHCIAALSRISRFRASDQGLTASPDPIRIARALPELRQTPLFRWLSKKPPSYRKAIAEVETHWGKHIVHRDLLVAKVKNLSLMVVLKKEFDGSAKMVFLPNDFIAFPVSQFATVQSIVIRNGFAVKTLDAS
jgi:hypothetical protein